MSTKTVSACAVVLALLALSVARAAEPPAPGSVYPVPGGAAVSPPPVLGPTGTESDMPPPTVLPTPGLSSWITYTRPDCCGPLGAHGPIGADLYFRYGLSSPVGGGLLSDAVDTGWMFELGGRSLFFNAATDRAWAVDLGLFYMYNNGNRPDLNFDLFGSPVNVRALHRSGVNFGLGREWFLLGPAYEGCDNNWRVGVDGGGRYGTTRVELNDTGTGYQRRHDVIGGFYFAVHSDVEFVRGCCKYLFGVRLEWDYFSSDVLPGSDAELNDVNFLLNFGVRF